VEGGEGWMEAKMESIIFSPTLLNSPEHLSSRFVLLSSYFPIPGGQASHHAIKRLSRPPETHTHTLQRALANTAEVTQHPTQFKTPPAQRSLPFRFNGLKPEYLSLSKELLTLC